MMVSSECGENLLLYFFIIILFSVMASNVFLYAHKTRCGARA